jgi:hypothetical protein
MPTGPWYGGTLSPGNQGAPGNITGSGPSSQRRDRQGNVSSAWVDTPYGGDRQGHGAAPSPAPTYGGPGAQSVSQRFLAGDVGPRTGSTLGGGGGLGFARGLVDTMYAPQQQLLNDQLARQRSSLGLLDADADRRRGALQRDNDLARQGIGLDRQGLGIDQGYTQTQLGNLDKLRGILKQQYGLNDKTLANTLKQLGIDEAGLRDNAERKQWDLRSDLTARGAHSTVANARGTGRISRDLMYGLGGIGTQRTAAGLSHEGNRLGLTEKGIGYDNQAAGLNARLANIGLDTKRLGISEQQLANSLQDGLDQIGLGHLMDTIASNDAMQNLTTQQAQVLSSILAEVSAMTGIPFAQLQPGGSGGGTSTRRTLGRQL